MPVEQLDLVFAALADPTRRAILARLADGEATVNELVAPFDLSQPTISKHLKVLERAGLVSRGREAQFRPVRLNATPLGGEPRSARCLCEGTQAQGGTTCQQTQAPVSRKPTARSSSRAPTMRRRGCCSRPGASP